MEQIFYLRFRLCTICSQSVNIISYSITYSVLNIYTDRYCRNNFKDKVARKSWNSDYLAKCSLSPCNEQDLLISTCTS